METYLICQETCCFLIFPLVQPSPGCSLQHLFLIPLFHQVVPFLPGNGLLIFPILHPSPGLFFDILF